MFKHILLPTDGSDLSERAVLAGVSFAREIGAGVVGLTVTPEFHTFTYKTEMLEATEEEFAASSQRQAALNLAVISNAAATAGVPCEVVQVTSDEPWAAILQTSTEHGCDLIIMASHGRRGLKAVILGSETQKVLIHTSIPVLVYR